MPPKRPIVPLSIAPLNWWGRQVSRDLFANLPVRREGKAFLFSELSEALRQGCPMDHALALMAQGIEKKAAAKPEAMRWIDKLLLLLSGIVHLFITIDFLVSGRLTRILAARLHLQVEKGLLLSQAMRRLNADFDEEEVALVELGEQTNTLPQTLKSLAEFEAVRHKYSHYKAKLLYPLMLMVCMGLIASFLVVMIVPRYVDMIVQIGGNQLPPVTQALIDIVDLLNSHAYSFLILLLAIIAIAGILRVLMVGSVAIRAGLICCMIFGILVTGLTVLNEMTRVTSPFFGPQQAIAALGGVLVLVFLVPFLLSWFEQWTVRAEHRVRKLLRIALPLNPFQAEGEGRFLSALAIGLQAGLPEVDAMEMAGRTLGEKYRLNASRAADWVNQGIPVGEACTRAHVLSKATASRLVFLDGQPEYIQKVLALAQECGEAAHEQLTRYGWMAQVASVVACGAVALLIAVAMYMPLFKIPVMLVRQMGD